ncbi:MAG TPA: XdhC family protein [Phenylobacterium sp.]|nr:XdhC family protein [Phenylobacterium sp.]
MAIFGAGAVGQAFERQFRLLPFNVEHYDSREAMAQTGAVILPEDDMVEIAGCLEPDDFALIATPTHDLDYRLVRAVLQRSPMRYCGLMGSRKKRADFEVRLAADGLTGEQIGRLSCPVGIASLHSASPAVIAVAAAAEVLQVLEADAAAP